MPTTRNTKPNTRTPSRRHSPIEEGLPRPEGRTPDGKYTWAELDAKLRQQGSSLAERVERLGGPKANQS